MNIDKANIVVGLVDRIGKLKTKIFEFNQILENKSFTISSKGNVIELVEDEIATVVFSQDILQYYIDTLNLELTELVTSLEEI